EGRGSRRRVLPAARPEWAGRSAGDRHGPGHLRHARERRGRVPVGSALPEPDDADPRARGCFAPLAVGPGPARAARSGLQLNLLGTACWTRSWPTGGTCRESTRWEKVPISRARKLPRGTISLERIAFWPQEFAPHPAARLLLSPASRTRGRRYSAIPPRSDIRKE